MQRQRLAAVGSSAVLCGPSLLLRLFQRRKSSVAGKFQLGNVLFDSSVHQPEINTQVVVPPRRSGVQPPPPINRRLRGLDVFAQLLTGLGQRLEAKKLSRPPAVYSSMRAMQRKTCFR